MWGGWAKLMYGQWLDLELGYNVQTPRIMNTGKKFSWITLSITSCECKILTFFTENFTKFGKDRWELAVGFVNLTQLLTADYSKVEILEKPPSFHVPECQLTGNVRCWNQAGPQLVSKWQMLQSCWPASHHRAPGGQRTECRRVSAASCILTWG